ncbi:MAG: hypothetical protein JJU36_00945 [Phycisphaeraceae bacterium]|nr:hypothetical protein [Phycisphaeraceae bacterium]
MPRLAEGARKSFPKLYGHYGQVAIERLLRRQVIADRKFDQPWLLDSSNIQDFLARLRPGFQFIAGFRLRCTPLFEKHQAAIRRFLQPAMPYRAQSEAFLAPLRRRYEKLVGLMIRQTDYRTFRDGRYFMDTEQYRVLVHQILDRFGPDTGIVAASDEPQVPDAFAGLPVHLCSGAAGLGGHYIESFTQLGMCDAVVSVPSTFSLWATFMGRTPLLMLPAGRPDLDAAVWMDSAMIEGRHRPELATFLY